MVTAFPHHQHVLYRPQSPFGEPRRLAFCGGFQPVLTTTISLHRASSRQRMCSNNVGEAWVAAPVHFLQVSSKPPQRHSSPGETSHSGQARSTTLAAL
ncbi:hypothetical protein NL676_009642 [Syzygium grande]|nr:hypothetical protein NL676_009642 [Syzygium grande]